MSPADGARQKFKELAKALEEVERSPGAEKHLVDQLKQLREEIEDVRARWVGIAELAKL